MFFAIVFGFHEDVLIYIKMNSSISTLGSHTSSQHSFIQRIIFSKECIATSLSLASAG